MKEIKLNLMNSCRQNLPKNHPLFIDLQKLTSKNNLYKNIWSLQSFLNLPQNQQVVEIIQRIKELRAKFSISDSFKEQTKLQEQVLLEKAKIEPELFEKVDKIATKLENYENYGKISLENNEAIEMLKKLILENTNQNKTDLPIQNLFIPSEKFHEQFRNDTKVFYLRVEEVFSIPIYMFASAEGLHNWHGRKAGKLKDGQISSEVIKEYSKMEAETVPPVFDLSCYVYPNGQIYFISGNSHRVAAAFLRGDKNIPFNGGCTVYLIDDENPKPNYQQQSPEKL